MMPRATHPADTPRLLAIAHATGVFKPFEVDALEEVLADYHAINYDNGHHSLVVERAGTVAGFCYLAPAALTDRCWDLWWLAVDPAYQGQQLGQRLINQAEALARAESARLLLIETSSTPLYQPARGFYLRQGYTLAAEVADFYADGDAKLIYAKRLIPRTFASVPPLPT